MSGLFQRLENKITRSSFFKFLANKFAAVDVLESRALQFKEIMIMESINTVTPNIYLLDGDGMNPAFLEMEYFKTLSKNIQINEKFIFLLTEDFALRTGKKNDERAGAYLDNFSLDDAAMSDKKRNKLKAFLAAHLFGHPTVALCDEGYLNGLYAGWFCKRTPERIDILLSTGRFKNVTVSNEQRRAVEAHIARRMMAALGVTEVRFIDYYPLSLDEYLANRDFAADATYRTYTAAELKPELLLAYDLIVRPERRSIVRRENLEVVQPPLSKAFYVAK